MFAHSDPTGAAPTHPWMLDDESSEDSDEFSREASLVEEEGE